MTKLEIITEAGRRLGDTSTEYLSILSNIFNFVLIDLSAGELIDALHKQATFAITEDARTYNTRTITALSAPFYPLRILALDVPSWGYLSHVKQAENVLEFERFKGVYGEDYRDRFRMWRTYPNRETLEVWPPASAEAATATATVTYITPVETLDDGDDIEQLFHEDLETVVWGLVARGCPFKEDTGFDLASAYTLYEKGKSAMWARKFNSAPGRIAPAY